MITLPFPAATPYPRSLTLWEPEGAPRGLVLISHGMAEHTRRYDALGQYLAGRGYLVCGYNHLGHGEEAPKKGYFSDNKGWNKLLIDLDQALGFLTKRYPGVPAVLLGHSMGSFLAREYALRQPDRLAALVISGTGFYPPAQCLMGYALAGLHCAFGQGEAPARLIHQIAFAGNNKPFTPAATPNDWLSRDADEVRKYEDDPLCGFVFTARGYHDLFGGLLQLSKVKRLDALPKELPVLLISGGEDPVGDAGEGVKAVANEYRKAGLAQVEVRLYPGARHELFHEQNREAVFRDLANWLDAALPQGKEISP